jgi:hypothetical protein
MLCGCCRRFLLGGAAATLACVATLPILAQPSRNLPRYCSAQISNLNPSQFVSTFGNDRLNNALIAELKHITSIIPVDPGFKYLRDDASPNAFAIPDTIVPGTRGTCVFGINLVKQEINASPYGGVAVAGICAHECGHIFQFNSKYSAMLAGRTAKYVELHADYIAGYYMGRRRQFNSDRIAVFAKSLFAKGDYAYNDKGPSRHARREI